MWYIYIYIINLFVFETRSHVDVDLELDMYPKVGDFDFTHTHTQHTWKAKIKDVSLQERRQTHQDTSTKLMESESHSWACWHLPLSKEMWVISSLHSRFCYEKG